MKPFALALLFVATLPAVTVFRADPTPVMITAGNTPPGGFPALYAVAGASINICTDISCATPATTYTDATGATTCPLSAPITLAGTSLCTSTTGPQGQFGFWLVPGTYYYKVILPGGQTFGNFPISGNTSITGVSAFNSRVGAVTPQAGDYTAALVGLPNVTNNAQVVDPGGNGIVKRTGPTTSGIAGVTDITGLFVGCSGINYLGADGNCHSAGTGSVTSVGSGAGLVGGPITGSGTLTMQEFGLSHTTTSYTFQNGDCYNLVTRSNSGSMSDTLPTSNSGGQFLSGLCAIKITNYGPGTLTITPATGTIGGASNLVLTSGQGAEVVSNAGNWDLQPGKGGGGGTTSYSVQLLDWFNSSTKTSSTVLTICQGASSTTPCTFRVGAKTWTFTTAATVTGTTFSGTAYIYGDSSGVIGVGVPSGFTSVACSGCTIFTGITQFPTDGSVPLFSWNATANTWDSTGVDARAVYSSWGKCVGTGSATCTRTADTTTINVPSITSICDPTDTTCFYAKHIFAEYRNGQSAIATTPAPWYYTPACSAISDIQSPAKGEPGALTLSGAGCYYYYPGANGTYVEPLTDFISGVSPLSYVLWERFWKIGTTGNYYLGWSSNGNSVAGNFVGIRYNQGSAVYQCVIINGGVDVVSTNMGTTPDTSVHSYRVYNSGTANSVTCSIDGANITTSAGTIPASNWFGLMGTSASANTIAAVEARIWIQGLSR